MKQKKERSPRSRALRTGAIIVALFLLYAYATQATEVNLEAPLEERRQAAVMRALRGLARPDFFVYDEETRSMNITIRMPCSENVQGSQTTLGERTVRLTPNCVTTTQDLLVISGSGFRPFTDGLLRWYPPSTVEGSTRALTRFHSDGDGNFEVEFSMPDIRPSEEPQRIEVEEKWRTGIAGLSEASKITLSAITETVLLALMATTLGTLLSIPISFLAARNLMAPIGMPLAAIMGAIVALPLGFLVAGGAARLIFDWSSNVGVNLAIAPSVGEIGISLGLIIVAFAAIAGVMRVSVSSPERSERDNRLTGLLRMFALALLAALALALLADLFSVAGRWLEARLGLFDFVGGFIAIIFEFVDFAGPAIIGFFGGLIAMSTAGSATEEALLRLPERSARIITIVLTALGGFVLVYSVGSGLDWLYEFDNPAFWTLYPALAAAALGVVAGALVRPRRSFGIGLVVYTLIRSILNIVRSIEPLVYVIIFAVWVEIGPFAGILALTLHTIAALGKLFSEQVENIASGPIEAITATGASRIQTVVFGVIPQIIPPYIAFTLYRWDINVRMSTIIGFGGGGGIGFVLAQAINLLRYRQASVMMLAIAAVVMTLDYISSKVRTRIL